MSILGGDRLALLDLDGVICDDRHRVEHALARRWGDYFGLMHLDTVWPQGRRLYEDVILAGFDVGYCTGRRRDYKPITRRWLKKRDFDHTLPLIMRREEDRRPLAEVKAGIVAEALEFGYREVWLWDDDPHVIELAARVPGATAKWCTWHTKPSRMVRRART